MRRNWKKWRDSLVKSTSVHWEGTGHICMHWGFYILPIMNEVRIYHFEAFFGAWQSLNYGFKIAGKATVSLVEFQNTEVLRGT